MRRDTAIQFAFQHTGHIGTMTQNKSMNVDYLRVSGTKYFSKNPVFDTSNICVVRRKETRRVRGLCKGEIDPRRNMLGEISSYTVDFFGNDNYQIHGRPIQSNDVDNRT